MQKDLENLFHFSKNPVKFSFSKVFEGGNPFKPKGFWVSVGDSWKEWCESEQFALKRLKYKYSVKLKKNHNILHLTTPDQILEFSKKFPDEDYPGYIDFEKVYPACGGLIISPYQWECRLNFYTSWYYGWDCESGCIWDLNNIDNIFETEEK